MHQLPWLYPPSHLEAKGKFLQQKVTFGDSREYTEPSLRHSQWDRYHLSHRPKKKKNKDSLRSLTDYKELL